MPDECEPFDAPPAPIDGGRVAQVIVVYAGLRQGRVLYRGRVSGREYFFGADRSHGQQYVLLEDSDHFRRVADLRVLEDSKIDPREDRLKSIERELAEAQARLSMLADQEHDESVRTARNRGGRPPTPLQELQRLWHLRRHTLPPWSIPKLAAEFLHEDNATPRATISTRLSRFKKKHPELLSEEACPFCADGCGPPRRALVTKPPGL